MGMQVLLGKENGGKEDADFLFPHLLFLIDPRRHPLLFSPLALA
jgi:hypothetical protein